MIPICDVHVPKVKIQTPVNSGRTWKDRAREKNPLRVLLARALSPFTFPVLPPDCFALIVFTRIAPHPLDDDNLALAFKTPRDEVAKRLGYDDNPSTPLRWGYRQEKSSRGVYGFRVRIEYHYADICPCCEREL